MQSPTDMITNLYNILKNAVISLQSDEDDFSAFYSIFVDTHNLLRNISLSPFNGMRLIIDPENFSDLNVIVNNIDNEPAQLRQIVIAIYHSTYKLNDCTFHLWNSDHSFDATVDYKLFKDRTIMFANALIAHLDDSSHNINRAFHQVTQETTTASPQETTTASLAIPFHQETTTASLALPFLHQDM